MPAQFGPFENPPANSIQNKRGKRVADRVSVRTGARQTGRYARLEPKGQDTYPPRGENDADGPVSRVPVRPRSATHRCVSLPKPHTASLWLKSNLHGKNSPNHEPNNQIPPSRSLATFAVETLPMNHPAFTKVERQILDARRTLGQSMPTDPAAFRQALRLTAYHEAGHVAARMFTGLEANHLLSVSIIPDSECEGHAKSERNVAIGMLQSYPPPKIRTAGRCLLLTLLAGRGAETRLNPRKKKAAPNLQARLLQSQILVPLSREWETPDTDLFHAWRVATIMRESRKEYIWRVLERAEIWTIEMLAMPPVWASVEKLANMLLERGTIADPDEIDEACDEIRYLGITQPKWYRRLVPTLAERKAMGWPTGPLQNK